MIYKKKFCYTSRRRKLILSKLQNSAARIILKADIMAPSSYMFEQLIKLAIDTKTTYV